jgi:FkbH-like protein
MTTDVASPAPARTSGTEQPTIEPATRRPRRGRIKCVVWDLDNTLWDGILAEGDELTVKTDVIDIIRRLDRLGILHSVASKNDHAEAMARLRAFGIDELFLYPEIGWHPKSHSIQAIAKSFNIGLDAIAFVDDQEFERAEVAHALPQVMCLDVAEIHTAVQQPEFCPQFVTAESAQRRDLYRRQIVRAAAEREFVGTSEEFLAGLDMVFTIARAGRDDLQRAEELTVRTNQLNSTGRTFSYAELERLCHSPDHLLLVASLTDRFGGYGTIGLTLVEKDVDVWHLRLLLMSCRVVSRGVGTILLNHVMGLARAAGVRLRADFVETGRNRMMQVTYAFAGFREVDRDGTRVVLECDSGTIQPQPPYVRLQVDPAVAVPDSAAAGEGGAA